MRTGAAVGWLCAASVAVCAVMLSLAPPAEAGKGKSRPSFVRVGNPPGLQGPRFTVQPQFRSGRFQAKKFDKRRRHRGFAKRGRHRDRPFYVPLGYYSTPGYVYDYRPGVVSAPGYPSEARAPAPAYETPPVTPKWIHVGDDGGSILADGAGPGSTPGDGAGRNCLSVKTEITVDGKPVDAFGEACLLADGSWRLRPTEATD